MELYPIKFTPIFKYKLWGGHKLKTYLKKNYKGKSIGESWEISDVNGSETKVAKGFLEGQTLKQLIKKYKGDFLGEAAYKTFGNNFPVLIKFIDSKTPLSIQVHPSNKLAKKRHNSFGKNEIWYIMKADKDAELIVGFETEINKNEYQNHLSNDTLLEVLHNETVNKGDTFYIPTGRIHSVGAGILLAEIQQTSDITYRIHDYNRKDSVTGEERELHTELALDAIDFKYYNKFKTDYKKETNISNTLVHTPYFKTNFIKITNTLQKDYTNLDSFVIFMCVSGNLELTHKNQLYTLSIGETILLPANIKKIELTANKAEILEIYL